VLAALAGAGALAAGARRRAASGGGGGAELAGVYDHTASHAAQRTEAPPPPDADSFAPVAESSFAPPPDGGGVAGGAEEIGRSAREGDVKGAKAARKAKGESASESDILDRLLHAERGHDASDAPSAHEDSVLPRARRAARR